MMFVSLFGDVSYPNKWNGYSMSREMMVTATTTQCILYFLNTFYRIHSIITFILYGGKLSLREI